MRNVKSIVQRANKNTVESVVVPLGIIFLAAAMRLVPHPANVAPIAAMALFGGIYINKKYALGIPLIALFLSDIVIGFYQGMGFVYGSFLLIGAMGLLLKRHVSAGTLLVATITSSILFFLLTNFGVWLTGTLYPKTLAGLFMCYTAGLPFFRNTLLGDMLYMGIFVLGYKTILLILKAIKPATLPQKE